VPVCLSRLTVCVGTGKLRSQINDN